MNRLISIARQLAAAGVLAALGACSASDGGQAAPETAASPSATPIGVPVGVSSSATIGPAGGSLSSSDGRVTLTLPAGALPSQTTLSIEPISNRAHGGIGVGYRLAPDGLALKTPATLSFHYRDSELVGSAPALLGAASRSADGLWRWSGGVVDTNTHTLAVATSHLSDWSLVSSFVLSTLPPGAPLAGTRTITGQYCYGPTPAPSGDSVAQVGYRCDLSAEELARQRAVGPLARWILSAGTITRVDDSGVIICVFPEGLPSTPPITVSVEIAGPDGQPIRLENPVVWVREQLPASFAGFMNFSADESDLDNGNSGRSYRNGTGFRFTLRPDPGDPLHYRGRGRARVDVTYHFFGMTCDPLSVDVDIDFTMVFDSPLGVPYEMGGFGSYTAQTRCCAAGVCQPQDVSSAVTLPFAACTIDGLPVPDGAPDGSPIYVSSQDVECTVGTSKFTSHADWTIGRGP